MALPEIINCGQRGGLIPAFSILPIPDGIDKENLLGGDIGGFTRKQILRFLFNTKTIQIQSANSYCSLRDAVGGNWEFSQTLDWANGMGSSPMEATPDQPTITTPRRMACGFQYTDTMGAGAPDLSSFGSYEGEPHTQLSLPPYPPVVFGNQNLNQSPTFVPSPAATESLVLTDEGAVWTYDTSNVINFWPFNSEYSNWTVYYDPDEGELSEDSKFYLFGGTVNGSWGMTAHYAGDDPPAETSGYEWFGASAYPTSGGAGVNASCSTQLATPDPTTRPIVGYYSFVFADGVSSSVPIYQDPFTPETRYADAYALWHDATETTPGGYVTTPCVPPGPALGPASAINLMSLNLSAGVIEEWIGGVV